MSQPPKKQGEPKVPPRTKATSPHYKANNEGGYGNPPVKAQFLLGGKAGPGRRKGDASIEAYMRRMLREKVPRTNGPSVPMAKAFATAARNTMLTGGVRGIELGLRLSGKFGDKSETDPQVKLNFDDFTMLELHVFDDLLSRASNWPLEEPKEPDEPVKKSIFDRPPFSPLGLCMVSMREDGRVKLEKLEAEDTAPTGPSPDWKEVE